MRTIEIEWTEVSRHRVAVNVPRDFDAEEVDLANDLATLTDGGFVSVEREGITVRPLEVFDTTAETFTPDRLA